MKQLKKLITAAEEIVPFINLVVTSVYILIPIHTGLGRKRLFRK